jgi:hypothetical protein
MMPNMILDMTALLAPFCAGCIGVALVGLGALVAVAMDERARRRRPGVAIARPVRPAHATPRSARVRTAA